MVVEGKHAPWRLWILIVFWVLQLLLLAFSLVIYITALITFSRWDDLADTTLSRPSIAAIAINLAALIVSLVLTISEIVQVGRRRLTPLFYLISNTVKAVVWTSLTVAGIIIARHEGSLVSTGVTGIVAFALLLFYILPMIYGIITFIQVRRSRYAYNNVDPILRPGAYSAATPGNVELESQPYGRSSQGFYAPPQQQSGAYVPQKDARFEAYRQSGVVGAGVPTSNQAYGGGQTYDAGLQYHQQTGYVS